MSSETFYLNKKDNYQLIHHGGKDTVTGSCHELFIDGQGILIDCGLFQGQDSPSLLIEFPVEHIQALLITHAHIDHIGRLPWLLAAGFNQPIYCTEATAELLPLMLDDGLKLQLGLNRDQRQKVLSHLESLLKPLGYNQPQAINSTALDTRTNTDSICRFSFQPAGHILGSAYIEITLPNGEVIVFSGDLGPQNTPLLPDPVSPKHADYLVIETTYGNKRHDDIATRAKRLEAIVQKALQDGGVILVPAFSVGRTQELLFDIERLIEHSIETESTDDDFWQQLPIILDSPLAIKVSKQYEKFRNLWNKEAKQAILNGKERHAMAFEQFVTVNFHREHSRVVNRLASTNESAIVVAASGMCTGGRIVNYLKALLPDKRTDVILVGYQAEGTLGYGLQNGDSEVTINNIDVTVNAQIHQMSGYSAHADQADLIAFVDGIESKIKQIHLIHGEPKVKEAFKQKLKNKSKLNDTEFF